jgi:IS5 family transposase
MDRSGRKKEHNNIFSIEVSHMPARFRPSGRNSYWGDGYLEMAVAPNHFLRRLRGLFDWEELTESLAECYKGGAEYGPTPYHPALLFKMLTLSFLYDLSERQTEEFANENMPARYFLGLAGNQSAPDHCTLTVFKQRIIAREGPQAFEERFQRIVQLAREKGITPGRIQIVDSTHTIANVDVKKDDERRDGGAKPRDEDAAWGSKGRKKVKTGDGTVAIVNKAFYGYKTHLSLNAESGIITSVEATPGNRPDGKQFPKLVKKDEQVGIEAQVYAGDKGYDDGDNHEMLFCRGKSSALCLNKYRTQLYPEGLWADLRASEDYQAGLKERYRIEQKNAEAKVRHGLDRCRYIGLPKYAVQSLMTAIALNLKRMVLLLCGVGFRGPVRSLAKA